MAEDAAGATCLRRLALITAARATRIIAMKPATDTAGAMTNALKSCASETSSIVLGRAGACAWAVCAGTFATLYRSRTARRAVPRNRSSPRALSHLPSRLCDRREAAGDEVAPRGRDFLPELPRDPVVVGIVDICVVDRV